MDRCRFSVSMCVYGGDNANHFDLALESVYNQTLPPDEVVLVVDGPVPNIIDEVIKKYEEHNGFKIIRLAVNSGHGEARRIGLENCSNELVALMDSDDISVRDRFEKQICVFKDDDSESYEAEVEDSAIKQLDEAEIIHEILEKLSTTEQWTHNEFKSLCKQYNLMPNAAIEKVNNMVYDLYEESVLESSGEGITCDIDLVKEFLDERSNS